MAKYVFELPGEIGNDLTLEISERKLLEFVRREIEPIFRRSMAKRKLPALKQATIERKKRAGYSRPEQPLVATGSLEKSLSIKVTTKTIEVHINDYLLKLKGKWLAKFMTMSEIYKAINRGINKYLETV
jgi:hypothetical protein